MPPGRREGRAPSAAGSTRSVDRALDLLLAVTRRPDDASLTALARETGLSPATASRLLGDLIGRELVRRDELGAYRPGTGLMQMGAAVLRGDPLYDAARSHLVSLAAATGETANLAIGVDPERVLYVRQEIGEQPVQSAGWAGRTIPRRGTAVGAVLGGRAGPAGYASTRGTVEPDVTSIAAGVRDHDGRLIAALSVLAPSYRTGEDDVDRIGRLVVEQATLLSRALGAPDTGGAGAS